MGLADSAGNDGNRRQQLGRLDRFGDVVDVTGPQRSVRSSERANAVSAIAGTVADRSLLMRNCRKNS